MGKAGTTLDLGFSSSSASRAQGWEESSRPLSTAVWPFKLWTLHNLHGLVAMAINYKTDWSPAF